MQPLIRNDVICLLVPEETRDFRNPLRQETLANKILFSREHSTTAESSRRE